MLTDSQIERYSRQIIVPEIGGVGQERLLAAAVGIAGANALAAAAATYLGAAGVGAVAMCPAIAATVWHQNPDCRMTPLASPDTPAQADETVCAYDVILDADAPPSTSRLLGAACWRLKHPLVWARAEDAIGWMATFDAKRANFPCYDCFKIPRPKREYPRDDSALLAGATAQLMGTVMATEAIKLILGVGTSIGGRLWRYDALGSAVDEERIPRNPHCMVCGSEGRPRQ